MSRVAATGKEADSTARALQDLHMTILLALGVPQGTVARAVGVDIRRANRIGKAVRKARRLRVLDEILRTGKKA
jgi:hypothetical protein